MMLLWAFLSAPAMRAQEVIQSPQARPRMIPPFAAATPKAAPPQQKSNNEQSRASLVTAPGTDQTRFVPGSTVASFSQFEYFKLWKLLFRPTGTISYGYDSNLYASNEKADPNHSWVLAPTIETLLPIGSNGVRVDYTARYSDFSNYNQGNRLDHTVDADSQIDLTPVLNVAIRDHFAISSLDSREFLPGREVLYSGSRFRRNEVAGTVNWSLSEVSNAGLNVAWNRVDFTEVVANGKLPFYNYDQYSYGGFYRRTVSQRTSFFGDGTYFRNPTADPRGISDSKGYEAVGGFESELTPLLAGQVSVGIRQESYLSAPDQNHSAFVFRGSLTKEITDKSRLSFAFSRGSSLSFYQRNAYFMTYGLGLTYVHEVGSTLMFSLSPGYQNNGYPMLLEDDGSIPASQVGNEKRRDRMFELDFGARYRIKPLLALDFRFDFLRRRSTVSEYNFTGYRAGLSLLVGNSGIRMGRAPY
jgi:hypothetical protein